MPKVSIIIPVYNVEEYLEKCLNSVINQTLTDIEIICINDGSTDNSLLILENFARNDKRIIILNQENKGQSAARNNGLKIATGEFIGFVDSDDWIDLNYYEVLYNFAKKHEADIAVCGIIKVLEHKNEIYLKFEKEKTETVARKKYQLANIPKNCYVVNKIYNRKALLKSGVEFEEGVMYEDIEWTHKVLYLLGKMVSVSYVNYFYRDNCNSTVRTRNEKYYKDCSRAFLKSLDFIQRNNIKIRNLHQYHWTSKKEYRVFNIPFFTIKDFANYKRFYLFGKFMFLEIKNNNLNKEYEQDLLDTNKVVEKFVLSQMKKDIQIEKR